MPLYEYQCQECGEKTEVIQRFDEAPFSICSSCGGSLKKLVSAPAIKFKGSGFYLTDYGKGGSSATTSSSESSDTATSASDSGSSEKKTSDSGSSEKKTSDSGSAKTSTKSGSKSTAD